MIELARHIEILLLDNDCVVVPGFGGFIAYDMPASWNAEEKVFYPPLRTIGFNPQLKMNDGVLVQSYMEAYNTNFPDATKILERAVDQLIETLHRDGKVDLANIGEIALSVHEDHVFSSYDDKMISPSYYGLEDFQLQHLNMLRQPAPVAEKVWVPQIPQIPQAAAKPVVTDKKIYEIRINRAVVRNAVAAVAAILLFFYMSTPIGNTYVEEENYAQLLPADLFDKINQQSILTTPIEINAENNHTVDRTAVVDRAEPAVDRTAAVEPQPVVAAPAPTKTVDATVAPPPARQAAVRPLSKHYHVIIASVLSKREAQILLAELKSQGYSDTQTFPGRQRTRISMGSYSTREEADRQLLKIRKDGRYKDAWLLVQ